MILLLDWYKERLKKKYRLELARAVGAILAEGQLKLLAIILHPKSTETQILRAAEAYKSFPKVVKDLTVKIENHVQKEMD